MNEEYKMLRAEVMESIAKQDTLTNIIFTVLGASSVFSTMTNNIPFIILVELISAILLARVLHYRHAVLYIASYLERIEQTSDSCDIHWETNLAKFHSKIQQKSTQWNISGRILWKVVKVARILKHFGNLILSIYLFSPIFPMLKDICVITGKSVTINFEILLALIALISNIVFSLGICLLFKLRPGYASVWEDVLPCPDTK